MARPRVLAFAGRILFDSFFQGSRARGLRKSFDVELISATRMTPAARRSLAGADAIITTWDSPPFGADLTDLAPRLRMIAHLGGEVKRRFDPSLFSELTITNSAGPFARPTAEFAAALLLYSARNIDAYRTAMQKQPTKIYRTLHATGILPGTSNRAVETLAGQEVSLIGLGRIGRMLIELLRGFDIRWLVYDPYASREIAREHRIEFLPLNTLLKRGHRLVLAAAATSKTERMLNAETLAKLPDGALVVNVARGSLIDLDALTQEVRSGRLRCALDVTDPEEPLPEDHPLRKLAGAILTPHVAAGGIETRREMAEVVLEDLERFFRGEPVLNRVTPEMLGRMT